MLKRNTIMNSTDKNRVSISECAVLAKDVYHQANDRNRILLPSGWQEFKESGHSATGYFGRCYLKNFNKENGPYFVAFAHCGTVITEIGDLFDSLNIALGNIPGQIAAASRFITNTAIALANKYKDLDWAQVSTVQTGHSLGAILADLSSLGTLSLIPSVTFENPGSKPIMLKYLQKRGIPNGDINYLLAELKDFCTAYQAGVNLINTCNEQLGTTMQLSGLPYNYGTGRNGPMLPISSRYWANPYYLYYTLEQHSMDNIYQYLQRSEAVNKVEFPNGFNQGYVAYLEGARKDYWDGYLNIIWATRPDIREMFKQIDKFYDDFYRQLKLTQDEAGRLVSYEATQDLNAIVIEDYKSEPEDPEMQDLLNDFVMVDQAKPEPGKPLTSWSQQIKPLFSLFMPNASTANIEEDFVFLENQSRTVPDHGMKKCPLV